MLLTEALKKKVIITCKRNGKGTKETNLGLINFTEAKKKVSIDKTTQQSY